MKKRMLVLVTAVLIVSFVLPACACFAPKAVEPQVVKIQPQVVEKEDWEKSTTLKGVVRYYQWQIELIRNAPRENLIQALGPDIYKELEETYQKGGAMALMDKIPELFTRNEDPLATRYHNVYDVFRYRSGRCGEEAHLALGILYLFNIQPLEIVHSTADHVWLIVQGNHYDPGLDGEDRYDKTYYAKNWGAPFAFMLAIDLNGNVRDVTAEYIDITPEVIERRKEFIDEKDKKLAP